MPKKNNIQIIPSLIVTNRAEMGQNGPKRKSRLKKSILNTFKYSHVWSIFEANFVKIPNMASKYRSYALNQKLNMKTCDS